MYFTNKYAYKYCVAHLCQQLAGEVVQVQMDVVLVLADATALTDLHGHGARHLKGGGGYVMTCSDHLAGLRS